MIVPEAGTTVHVLQGVSGINVGLVEKLLAGWKSGNQKNDCESQDTQPRTHFVSHRKLYHPGISSVRVYSYWISTPPRMAVTL